MIGQTDRSVPEIRLDRSHFRAYIAITEVN